MARNSKWPFLLPVAGDRGSPRSLRRLNRRFRPSGMLGDDLKVVAISDDVAFFARDWTLARPVDLALLQSTG
jgi:hypothetical protein